MTGIMLKDLREAFCLRKNVIAWIFSMTVILFVLIAMPARHVYVLCVTVMFPMVGVSILQYSIEQDEISRFDKIMLTYPITKKEIILSKYLSGMLLQAAVFVFNFMMALLFSFGYKVIDFSMAMAFWFLGVILSFLFMAVNYMMFFWLGNKKGLILYLITAVILAVAYMISYYNVNWTGLLSMNRMVLMAAGFIISIFALIGSYFASAVDLFSAEDLMEIMELIPGSVTPFGLLNDKNRKVQFFLDQDFMKEPGLIGVHPNDNAATVCLKAKDLICIIEEHGNEVQVVEL